MPPSDSNGNFTPVPSYKVVNGDTVLPVQYVPVVEDISNGLTNRLMKDGRTVMTGNLQLGGFKVTGAADGEADTDVATISQVKDAIRQFKTVADLLADETLVYGSGAKGVSEGDIIEAQGFRYEVAASDAGEFDVETTSGVRLLVLAGVDGAYNVNAFGAKGDNANDDTVAIQAAVSKGNAVIPIGDFRVTAPIEYASNCKIIGSGRSTTIIHSEVIGDSLFKPSGDVVFFYMSDMELRGNDLTGEDGNGHAISMIDAVSAGGTFSPQNSVLERMEIRRFRGQDLRETSSATTICSAGIALYNALQVTIKEVIVANCGHGFYFYRTQNCRLRDCVTATTDKIGLFALDNENLIADGGDFLAGGDGVEDPGYPPGIGTHGSCTVLDHANQAFVMRNSKIKNNYAGTSLIRSIYSDNSVYDANWIRPDTVTDAPHKGFYAEGSSGIRITNNTFHPSNSGFSRDYEMIELYTTSNEITSFTIEGNTFGDVAGQDIAYNIKLGGNSSARAFQGSIRNNQFGFRGARGSAMTVDADIILNSCSLTDSEIAFNTFHAPSNVTRTIGISASNITNLRNTIGPNKWLAFGGTITAEMSGIRNDRYAAAVIYNPPGLADGGRNSTTVTVPGAALSDMVTVSLSVTTSGVQVYGYVSSANTVTVVFENNTGGTVDIGSVGLYVTCWRYKGPAV